MINKLNETAEIIKLDISLISNSTQTNKINIIYDHLKTIGVKTLDIQFSGGGDSGDINCIQFEFINESLPIELYDYNCQSFEIFELIHDWSHEFLSEETSTDWYNNEGGDGYLHFDFIEDKFSYVVNYNEIVSHEGETGERML